MTPYPPPLWPPILQDNTHYTAPCNRVSMSMCKQITIFLYVGKPFRTPPPAPPLHHLGIPWKSTV